MVRVSSKRLNKKEEDILYKRLVGTLWSARSKQKFHNVLSDLLTDSEEIVLAKRVSIIFLLEQGFSGYKIHKILNVSQNTVSYISDRCDRGSYKELQSMFSRKKEKEDMWAFIEILVRGGMPEYGKGRWKSLNR